jgi:F-type H+-transporting ATPase subunit epsilon
MATFQLEFVSPEKLLLSRPVEMALLPAADGQMGVLPGHAPMIVALRGGVISVREDGAETESLFVPGGFAEITPTRVTVLADEATPVAQLSRAEAESRIAEAEKALAALNTAEGATPEKREAAMARLLSVRAMLEAAQAA